MLEINNYSSQILNDISFSLQEHENLIILGSNGAGKSTLAKVLSNLISNDCVEIFLQNISTIEDKRRVELINYIPPKLEVFDEYITVYEFLELSFISSVNRNKIEEVIKTVGLDKIKDRTCINLSSGEKQLLLLASSMIHNAKITIFDELTANMDINRVKEVYELFKGDFLEQKIVITHNLDLAYNLKYKVLFLENGRVKFFGSSDEFFSSQNLRKIYGNCLKIVDNHLVVNL